MAQVMNAAVGAKGWKNVGDDDERQRKALTQKVSVEYWKPGVEIEVEVPEQGLSLFVADGSYGTWDNDVYEKGSLVHYPEESTLTLIAGRESGAYVLVIEGKQERVMASKL